MELLEQIQQLDFPAQLPGTLLEVEQRFDAPREEDLTGGVRRALERSGLLARIRPGASVAVGVGSRGVANIPVLARATVDRLREHGAVPFVTPAMGSHGGATAEGQIEMLRQLGVTEESAGAPIKATMEVRQIGRAPDGPPLYQDVITSAADHTLLINRVKPHTDFHGYVESGLSKMAVIGLGKQHGAAIMHELGGAAFQRHLAPAARVYEASTNLVGGIAVVENALDETACIEGLLASEIGTDKEADLLKRAKSLMAGIPFPELEVLVVRRMGKNISGTGMDTNILGRLQIPRSPEPTDGPDIVAVVALDLTEETHGNASGSGLANVITARLFNKVDWVASYTNGVTSGIFGIRRMHMPCVMADDRRAISVAVRCCGQPQAEARLAFIRDTLTLDRMWVSPNLRDVAEAHPRLRLVREVPLAFGPDGAMTSPWELGG